MAGDCQLVLVEEAVLDSFLIVLVRIEIILLKVLEKPRGNSSDTLDIHLSTGELLLAVLDRILKVFERKY